MAFSLQESHLYGFFSAAFSFMVGLKNRKNENQIKLIRITFLNTMVYFSESCKNHMHIASLTVISEFYRRGSSDNTHPLVNKVKIMN